MASETFLEDSFFAVDTDRFSVWTLTATSEPDGPEIQAIPIAHLKQEGQLVFLVPKAAWGHLWRDRPLQKAMVISSRTIQVLLDPVENEEAETVEGVLVTTPVAAKERLRTATTETVFTHQFMTADEKPSWPQAEPLRKMWESSSDDQFSSAREDGVGNAAQAARIGKLETDMSKIGANIERLTQLLERPSSEPPATPAPALPLRASGSGSSAKPPKAAPATTQSQDDLTKLGLTKEQEESVRRLVSGKHKVPIEKRKVTTDLGESEDDAEEEGEEGEDDMRSCLKQLTKLTTHLVKKNAGGPDRLDKLLGTGSSSSGGETSHAMSISKGPAAAGRLKSEAFERDPTWYIDLVEDLMRKANATSTSAATQDASSRPCPFFYCEHRARISNYESTINMAFILCGIIKALQVDRKEEALARSYAALGSLEQFAIDGGQWQMALELSMIDEPPYHAFVNRQIHSRVGRNLCHPKIVDPRINEMMQAKLRALDEAVERKKRLYKKGKGDDEKGDEKEGEGGKGGKRK